MANNLGRLRAARGWTQEETATAFGTTRNQYAKLEKGARRLSGPWIDRAARAFDVDAGDIVRGDAGIPVVGRVALGGVVEWIAGEPPFGSREVALSIGGDALGPLLVGGSLTFRNDRGVTESTRSGCLTIVTLSGEGSLVRRAFPASRSGRFHLLGHGTPPAFEREVLRMNEVISVTFQPTAPAPLASARRSR